MKKLFLPMLSSFIIILCFTLSNQVFNAETVLHFEECCTVLDVFGDNDKNIFVLCESKDNYNIICFDYDFNVEEKLYCNDVNNTTYAYKDDIFYFFGTGYEIDAGKETTFITVDYYDYFRNIKQHRVINYPVSSINVVSAADDRGNFYLADNNGVIVLSPQYKFLRTIADNKRITNVSSSCDHKTVFCAGSDGLVIVTDYGEFEYDIFTEKIFTGNDNYFSDSNGIVYRFENGTVREIYSGLNGTNGFAAVGRFLFGCKDDQLTAVDLDTFEEIMLKNIERDVFITSVDNRCICVASKGDTIEIDSFTEDDVETQKKLLSAMRSDSSSLLGSDSAFSSSLPHNQKGTFSNVYDIDKKQKTIIGIEPGSTVAEVKNNLYGGQFVFYDNSGYVKKSGKIGTGYYFDNTATGERYQIVIYGDLSGEGNINLNDKKALVNHLLGKNNLGDTYFKAADINGDAHLDLKDYVAMDSYLKGEYKIDQHR